MQFSRYVAGQSSVRRAATTWPPSRLNSMLGHPGSTSSRDPLGSSLDCSWRTHPDQASTLRLGHCSPGARPGELERDDESSRSPGDRERVASLERR